MKNFFFLFALISTISFSQVKVSGVVLDANDQPVSYANVIFKGSTVGTVSDEYGKFYLESEQTYTTLEVSFLGFETAQIDLKARNFDLKIVLIESGDNLDEVLLYSGKQKKKQMNS